jgi:NAD+ synthetase
MLVHNEPFEHELHPQLLETLKRLRQERAFCAKDWISQKAELINEYFSNHKLTSAVIAVSGGLDSAAVLALIAYASSLDKSPLKKIFPVALPVFDVGATNQSAALARARELCESLSLETYLIELSSAHNQLAETVEAAVQINSESWARGQLVSYIRTPALYYLTSLLSQQKLPGVICGTTNRDEGAYLGYVGKASDGMVDLQLIADLHKSEVYQVAKELSVPASILEAVPSGDMFDGRFDEQVFGAPYDFVELFLLTKAEYSEMFVELQKNYSEAARAQHLQLSSHLERLHRHNAHKYLGLPGSPAVFLNVMPSAVPGGWKE